MSETNVKIFLSKRKRHLDIDLVILIFKDVLMHEYCLCEVIFKCLAEWDPYHHENGTVH